jgi:hypothetical protein
MRESLYVYKMKECPLYLRETLDDIIRYYREGDLLYI